MANGWVKLDRSIQDHWSWSGSKFSEGQAIVDLHLRANHQPGRMVRIRGCFITLQRGQLVCSENDLASSWSWSRGKVRRFLSLLEKDGSIVQQKNNRATVISLCEYGLEADTAHDNEAGMQYSKVNSKKDSKQNNGQNSKRDSTQAKTGQHPNNSRYKRNPLMDGDLGKSIRLIGSGCGTAKSTSINKKEKKKEKEVKKTGKGKMVVADRAAYLDAVPVGFSSQSWAAIVEYLEEVGALTPDSVEGVAGQIQQAEGVASPDLCIECMRWHGWKEFNASWLESSPFFHKMQKKGAMEKSTDVLQDDSTIVDYQKHGEDLRRWLIDESHFLVLEKKITHEQRADIIAGKLDISPFLKEHASMCG